MKDVDCLLTLLKKAITQNESEIITAQFDWPAIYEMSRRNSIASIIYTTVLKIPQFLQLDPAFTEKWKDYATGAGLHQIKQNIELKSLLDGLATLAIRPIIFKGPALALIYPEPYMRVSGDVDMLIKEEDRDRLINYLNSNRYELMEEQWDKEVFVYSSRNGLEVEFHFRLWEGFRGKRIDILENMKMNEHTIQMKANGLEIITLDYKEHLIYQIYHLVKHFSLEGISLRYLADLTLFVNEYKDNIDFMSFWETISNLYYQNFCQLLFTICVEKLGMDEVSLNPRIKVKKESVESLLDDISEVGISFESDNTSWSTLNIIKPYLTGENRLPSNKFQIYLAILFPTRVKIISQYPYLERFHVLLPVAWVQRAFHHYFGKKQADTIQKVKKAQKRLELMQKMKLIKN